MKKIFNMKNDSADSLIDAVTEEFKLYELENTPSSFHEAKLKEKKREGYPIGNTHMIYRMWQQPILTTI